ncbi:MAG: hypothetical protein GTN78_24040 [Gemmatimonadales bacterium]|nr:hypothetical protein [Gemmatimonadales bacterium]
MKVSRWAWTALLAAPLAAVTGCGRPTLPGSQFAEPKVRRSVSKPATSPLPEEPILEWGNPDARVRVVAFYTIDDEHERLRELLAGLAEAHPDKVYVRYADYRTPQGNLLFRQAELQVPTVLINKESSVTIEKSGRPLEVTFVQEIGRYWTQDDLTIAVAQEVAKTYRESD